MLATPKNHLPKDYPLPTKEEHERFQPIFMRAFEIHKGAHVFGTFPTKKDKQGFFVNEFGPREGILSPVKGRTKLSKAQYCDCYERAYQELAGTILA